MTIFRFHKWSAASFCGQLDKDGKVSGPTGAIVEVLVICLVPPGFIHRPVPDGTTISFCNNCFATVAIVQGEAELKRAEQLHVCDPYGLEHGKEPSRENRSSSPDQS